MMFCEQIKNFNSLSKSLLLIIYFARHATQQILVVETVFCVKPTVNIILYFKPSLSVPDHSQI